VTLDDGEAASRSCNTLVVGPDRASRAIFFHARIVLSGGVIRNLYL
jgi:hypothetical protein